MADKFTIIPEFEYSEEENYKTFATQFDQGYVQKRAIWPRPKRLFKLNWNNATLSEKDYAISFFRETVGPAGVFLYSPQDAVPSPLVAGTPSVSVQAQGNYVERTYYYKITWVTSQGETLPTPEFSFLVETNKLFVLTLPRFPTNIIMARLYISTSAGTETLQSEITISKGTFIEPDSAAGGNGLVIGSSPPTANTAFEEVNVSLAEDTFSWSKSSPVSYRMAMDFEEILNV